MKRNKWNKDAIRSCSYFFLLSRAHEGDPPASHTRSRMIRHTHSQLGICHCPLMTLFAGDGTLMCNWKRRLSRKGERVGASSKQLLLPPPCQPAQDSSCWQPNPPPPRSLGPSPKLGLEKKVAFLNRVKQSETAAAIRSGPWGVCGWYF